VVLAEAQQLTEAGYGEALAQRRKRDRAGLCFARTSKASVHESKAEVGSASTLRECVTEPGTCRT